MSNLQTFVQWPDGGNLDRLAHLLFPAGPGSAMSASSLASSPCGASSAAHSFKADDKRPLSSAAVAKATSMAPRLLHALHTTIEAGFPFPRVLTQIVTDYLGAGIWPELRPRLARPFESKRPSEEIAAIRQGAIQEMAAFLVQPGHPPSEFTDFARHVLDLEHPFVTRVSDESMASPRFWSLIQAYTAADGGHGLQSLDVAKQCGRQASQVAPMLPAISAQCPNLSHLAFPLDADNDPESLDLRLPAKLQTVRVTNSRGLPRQKNCDLKIAQGVFVYSDPLEVHPNITVSVFDVGAKLLHAHALGGIFAAESIDRATAKMLRGKLTGAFIDGAATPMPGSNVSAALHTELTEMAFEGREGQSPSPRAMMLRDESGNDVLITLLLDDFNRALAIFQVSQARESFQVLTPNLLHHSDAIPWPWKDNKLVWLCSLVFDPSPRGQAFDLRDIPSDKQLHWPIRHALRDSEQIRTYTQKLIALLDSIDPSDKDAVAKMAQALGLHANHHSDLSNLKAASRLHLRKFVGMSKPDDDLRAPLIAAVRRHGGLEVAAPKAEPAGPLV